MHELTAIESVEAKMLTLPQITAPLEHMFAPGVYFRLVKMPTGSFIIGHEHTTKHINVVLSGKATVSCDGEVVDIVAPFAFVSEPGVRKVLLIHEEMIWGTIHPTDETDLQKLEDQLIIKSETFKQGTLCHGSQLELELQAP